MSLTKTVTPQNNKKFFLILFFIFFTVYVFSSDGHRATNDEEYAQQQTFRLVVLEPDPDFILGESGTLFKYPQFWYPYGQGTPCSNALLCYGANVAHSVTEYPFVFLNYHLQIFSEDTLKFSFDDFHDNHYVFWRNSIDPTFTFMELFFGPFYSALSISIFFLICRNFNYSVKTSLILSFVLALSTSLYAYSATSFNQISALTFLLLGFYLFRLSQKSYSIFYSFLSGASLVFGFMIREDLILFIIPLFFYQIIFSLYKNKKIVQTISFIFPLLGGYGLYRFFDVLRYGVSQNEKIATDFSVIASMGTSNHTSFVYATNILGLLFAPGIGLFIYVPILLTVFFSFIDFFKSHKSLTLLLLSFPILVLIHYGSFNFWHGLTAWSPKYLYFLIPFLLLPLGTSIENNRKKILPIILSLSIIGFVINLFSIIQDVNWFVWGSPGGQTGLFGLAYGESHPLYINDIIIWTFQFSPLIVSIQSSFTNLQPDIFLLKFFDFIPFFSILFILLGIELLILKKLISSNSYEEKYNLNY